MAANKDQKTDSKNLIVLVSVLVVMLTLTITLYVLWRSTKPTASQPITPTSAPQSSQPVTAGGQPVPSAYQARAKAAGYYCPSWAAAPGTTASDICIPLDK